MKKIIVVSMLSLIAVFILGAKEPTEQDALSERLNLPVAKIGDKVLTLGFVESMVVKQSPMLRKDLEDEKKRSEFLSKLIDMEALSAEAAKRGFKDHSEVASVRKNQLASLMHRRIAEKTDSDEAKPSDAELKKYYDEHHDNYHKPEKARSRHILITDKAKAEALFKDLKGRKVSQHEFRRLAQENSEDESTRLRGGDLTFFTKPEFRKEGDPEVDPAIIEATFKIKKNGDIHPELVKSSKGYHVIMRTGHRDPMDLSFEEAKDRLSVLVKRETRKTKIEDAINSLKDRFNVEVFEENLNYVVIDLSVGPPEPDAKGGLTKKERESRKKMLMTGKKGLKPQVIKKAVKPKKATK
ncbi:MAG: hypothetical protein GY854_17795 [Deltaproteobacteria bacterium]|nr:hypothetical protein [Deltaproteobacteria bacterium]